MNQPAAEQVVPATPRIPMLRTLGLVAALSGFLVVLAHHLTMPLIEENRRIAIERALFKVIPGAVSRRDFQLTADGIEPPGETLPVQGMHLYAGYNAQGRLAGVALEAAAQGYQDVIRVLFSYDPDCECIRGMEVLKMAETPGIGDKIAKDPVFLQNFEALDARLDDAGGGLANAIVSVKTGTKSEPWQIDAISGATISSKAVARMLNDTAQQALPVIVRNLGVLQQPEGAAP
jgi:electron transport complex protein RnfG